MNSVQLIGRMTRNPEVRYTGQGMAHARFTLAVDRRFKKDGEKSADFISCVAFGKTAEFIEMKYDKGRLQESQKEYLLRAMMYGHCCYVCYSAEDAIGILKEYLNLNKYCLEDEESMMKNGNGMIMKHGKVESIR